jgi:hypothetical protein
MLTKEVRVAEERSLRPVAEQAAATCKKQSTPWAVPGTVTPKTLVNAAVAMGSTCFAGTNTLSLIAYVPFMIAKIDIEFDCEVNSRPFVTHFGMMTCRSVSASLDWSVMELPAEYSERFEPRYQRARNRTCCKR